MSETAVTAGGPDAAPGASEASNGESPGPTLLIPESWVIDPIAKARLLRQLRAAGDDVVGIVAPATPLPPGSSFRVHAERCALEPLSVAHDAPAGRVSGAVLVRDERAAVVHDDGVEVTGGHVLVDPGAPAHDPWAPLGPVEAASTLGRPPFPWRPVVVLLACEAGEDDTELADWARATANSLVRRHVEARIAMPDAVGGLHLTRPCAPTRDSVAALAPDVLIALDELALANARDWYAGDAWTAIAHCTADPTGGIETVRWARNSGPVRARLGRGTGAAELAELVQRLRAGPHPLQEAPPPLPRATAGPSLRSRSTTRASVVLVAATPEAAAARFAGLADQLLAAGATCELTDLASVSRQAHRADIVVVRPDDPRRALDLVAARRRDDRSTVIDLAPEHVETAPDGRLMLGDATRELVRRGRRATATSAALRDAARRTGARAMVLPLLLPRSRLLDLRELRQARPAPSARCIAWWIGRGVPAHEIEAVTTAIRAVEARHDVGVEIVGAGADPDPAPRLGPRAVSRPGEPAAGPHWHALVWTPAPEPDAADLVCLAEAAVLGVPAIAPAARAGAPGRLLARELLVGDPSDTRPWYGHLERLAGGNCDTEWRRRIERCADALLGPAAAAATVNHFCGWALREPE